MGETQATTEPEVAPGPRKHLAGGFDAQLRREWLLTNGRGGFALGTVAGIPTRRYHGLLVAAARPPLERWMMLSAVLERIGVAGDFVELASFQFDQKVHPQGHQHLVGFEHRNAGERPWVRFEYAWGDVHVSKRLSMFKNSDEIEIAYHLTGPDDQNVSFELCPFLALRDFHALTRAFEGGYTQHRIRDWVAVDAFPRGPRVWMTLQDHDAGRPAPFREEPGWWYGFVYAIESARGLDDREDLFVPGWFKVEGRGEIRLTFRASADFSETLTGMPSRRSAIRVDAPAGEDQRGVQDRLSDAADQFIVSRRSKEGDDLTTILAGYPWFGDWGRDTFIALPGLLLETGRFDEARQVLEVFASAQQDGLIPNRFSDYGEGRDYNSVDASLWFVHGADAYARVSGDDIAWQQTLAPACERVIEAYSRGTQFSIHADPADGLVSCGDETTQLTWMDAKCGDVVFSPRHGKPVEINALWYHALCLMAERCAETDAAKARRYAEMADRVAASFTAVFWNGDGGYLYDVVRQGRSDPACRPNQIFAVSLPHSPLGSEQQQSVVRVVHERLLTPVGLRSLCRKHPSYAGHYGGGPFERDSVYHQGTVWAWLIGPFIEAYLRVNGFSPVAKAQARAWLQPLVDHLDEAGLGSVSEIFDGDPPHTPDGCMAQAWSVAELLRAWRMSA